MDPLSGPFTSVPSPGESILVSYRGRFQFCTVVKECDKNSCVFVKMCQFSKKFSHVIAIVVRWLAFGDVVFIHQHVCLVFYVK